MEVREGTDERSNYTMIRGRDKDGKRRIVVYNVSLLFFAVVEVSFIIK